MKITNNVVSPHYSNEQLNVLLNTPLLGISRESCYYSLDPADDYKKFLSLLSPNISSPIVTNIPNTNLKAIKTSLRFIFEWNINLAPIYFRCRDDNGQIIGVDYE